jgi:hypothetical protein
MARKRDELPAAATRKLKSLLKRGGTAKSITEALQASGEDVSVSTVSRRIREIRGDVAPPRMTPNAALRAEYASALEKADADANEEEEEEEGDELPAVDAIPKSADLEQVTAWLRRAERMGKIAYAKGDLQGMGQMGRLTKQLLEAKERLIPPEKPDPADNPNLAKLAAEARAKLHLYIDQALGKTS